MASSDSAKKVARVAARSGGGRGSDKKSGNQATWLFPVVLLVVVALGAGAIAYARSQNAGGRDNSVPPRARLSETAPFDHWHSAIAINICGEELPSLVDAGQDLTGIHSHGDGLVHVHPFTTRVSGERATLRRYLDTTGVSMTDDRIELPAGLHDERVYESGVTTCGGEESEWVMAYWEDAVAALSEEPTEIIRDDFTSFRFDKDLTAITLAFLPVGTTEIPPPSIADQTAILGQEGGLQLPEDTGGEPSIEMPIEPGAEGEAPADDVPLEDQPADGDDPAAAPPEDDQG